jgi:predicted nucleic acid-binding Zn ribbon protein
VRPDPDRVRLAAEALARARADAWARGDRPQGGYGGAGSPPVRGGSPGGRPPGLAETVPTPDAPFAPSWLARPRREDPQPLSAALGGLLSARGWRQQAAIGAVFGGWPEIVGPQLAAHTRPESFDDGQLVVIADSDAWAAQVRLLAPQVLRRLAEELGAGTIRRIRVHGPSRGSGGRSGVKTRRSAPRS